MAGCRRCAMIAIVVWTTLAIQDSTYSAKPTAGAARDENFSVYAGSAKQASEILKYANALRVSVAEEWLGEKIPDGFGRTTLNVRITEEDQSLTWLMEKGGPRSAHTTWVYTTPDKLQSSLAHEIAHTVLWCEHPELPAFAHEGIASSYDGTERQLTRSQALRWFAKTNRWPRLDHLLGKKTISPTNQSLYAASSSLAEFLLSRPKKNRQDFLEFSSEGAKSQKWDAALQKHYSIPSVSALQVQWQEWAATKIE